MKEVRIRIVAITFLKNGDQAGYEGETILTVALPGIRALNGGEAKGTASISNLKSGIALPITKFEKSHLFFADLSYSTQIVVGAVFELKKRWLDKAMISVMDGLPGKIKKLLDLPAAIADVIPDKIKAGDAYLFPLGVGRIDLPARPERDTEYTIPLIADRDTHFSPWKKAEVNYDYGNDQPEIEIKKGDTVGEVVVRIEFPA